MSKLGEIFPPILVGIVYRGISVAQGLSKSIVEVDPNLWGHSIAIEVQGFRFNTTGRKAGSVRLSSVVARMRWSSSLNPGKACRRAPRRGCFVAELSVPVTAVVQRQVNAVDHRIGAKINVRRSAGAKSAATILCIPKNGCSMLPKTAVLRWLALLSSNCFKANAVSAGSLSKSS